MVEFDIFEVLVPGRCYYAEFPDPVNRGCWLRARFYYQGTAYCGSHLMLAGFDLNNGGQSFYWAGRVGELLPIDDPWQPCLHETTMAE